MERVDGNFEGGLDYSGNRTAGRGVSGVFGLAGGGLGPSSRAEATVCLTMALKAADIGHVALGPAPGVSEASRGRVLRAE